MPFKYRAAYGTFLESFLKFACNFRHSGPILHGENVNMKKVSFDVNHRYSIQLCTHTAVPYYCKRENYLSVDLVRF